MSNDEHDPVIRFPHEKTWTNEMENPDEGDNIVSFYRRKDAKQNDEVKKLFAPVLKLSEENDEKTMSLLRDIVEGNMLKEVPPPPNGKFVSFAKIQNTLTEDIADDDPMHQEISKLDKMMSAMAEEVGEENVRRIANTMLLVLSDAMDYGKFMQMIDPD